MLLFIERSCRSLVFAIKEQATAELRKSFVRRNEKIQKVITDDFIEIDNIDRYIKT